MLLQLLPTFWETFEYIYYIQLGKSNSPSRCAAVLQIRTHWCLSSEIWASAWREHQGISTPHCTLCAILPVHPFCILQS